MKRSIAFFIIIFTVLCTGIAMADIPQPSKTTGTPGPAQGKDIQSEKEIRASFAKLPLSFIKNEGQKVKEVLFYEQGSGHATAFTTAGVSLSLSNTGKLKERKGTEEFITLAPLKASPFTIEALDKKEGKVNYFIGKDPKNWKTDIPTYGAILYRNVYPGIDMKFYGSNSQLEYDIIVSPHKDPSKVRLSYKGIEKLSLTPRGELEITLRDGSIFQKKPFIYQTAEGKKREVPGRFVLLDKTSYGFEVGAYDRTRPLVIDPALVYSTYLGGRYYDYASAITVDSSGSAYVAGYTSSTNFPTENPYQGSMQGGGDAFVAKLSPSGNSLVYSTYLGGNSYDGAVAIAVDSSGSAYVAGDTQSTNFPTENPYQGSMQGGGDAFVAKLTPSGNSLVYSTYLGGNSYDGAHAIAVDSSGSAYVAGDTRSTNFPTRNPYQGSSAGFYDAFVAKLSPSGTSLVYSTYLGGSYYDYANAIAVDSSGSAYVAGDTDSTNFPTRNPYQGSSAGDDGFVTKLSPSGSSLVYSTYLGGSSFDFAYAIAVDSSGSAYVAGYTGSPNFPTKNPYQGSNTGLYDAFITKLSPSGTSLVYSTYLGGNNEEYANAIAVDSSGSAYVAGYTISTNFPTRNPYQGSMQGGTDAFVAKLSPSGTSLVYSTYLGGSMLDYAYAVAVDSSGSAYVAGYTNSTNFPTRNPYQGSNAGGSYDAFVAKLTIPQSDILWRNISTGKNLAWHMAGTTRTGSAYLPTISDQDWRMIATVDFNGDGKTDIIWRNTATGKNRVFYMNGATCTGTAYLPTLTDQNWRMIGTGDFNGDGKTDIIWRNTSTGQNMVWYMNGVAWTDSAYLPGLSDQNWRMIATGDFNGDGKPDILWRNTFTGLNQVWYMNGRVRTGSAYLPTITDQEWRMIATDDFNGDGKPDILWRNSSTGKDLVWYMDGATRTGVAYLPTVTDQNWEMVGGQNNY